MKILVVTAFYAPAWATGGIARATTGLARELTRLGHDVLVVTTRWDTSDPACEDSPGLCVRRFESPRWLRERLFPWPHGLARWLSREVTAFEIAHLAGHRTGLAFVAWRALRRAHVPYVLQPHGTYPHHAAWRGAKVLVDKLFGNALMRQAAALVAVSRAEAMDLSCPAQVIPNGVDDVGPAARVPHPLAHRVLFVGNDAPQKRGLALAALLAALPDVQLTFVGTFREAFREAFRSFGERVEFRGVLANEALAAAYSEADLLVQPAVGEAFGLAPFEAALRGTAAVVAGGHGSGEWFGQAGGCVVPPDDAAALAAAVRRHLTEPDLAAREADAVAAFAQRELSWSQVAGRIEAVYRDVLKARGGIGSG